MNDRNLASSWTLRLAVLGIVAVALPVLGQQPKAEVKAAAKPDASTKKAEPPQAKPQVVAPAAKPEAAKADQPKAAATPEAHKTDQPKAAEAGDPARESQAAEIRKQIEALQKQLEALNKPSSPASASTSSIPESFVKNLNWRSLGPANMGGRVVALSVFEADPSTYFVATGGGGLLKTTNNGITFEHLFDKQATVAIGDVCVAPSNKEVVWVGTGENNPRNSVSYGDGVYKSTDGGKTWTNMGLKATFQIGKILIHPTNPDIVYVGALGRLYGPNPDRGLYKTTDGGKTWNKILYVDDKTGVIDMRMHPTDPETLVVAMYERLRDGYDVNEPVKKHGPGAGIHKTTDGGKTFKKLTQGLPTVNLGRIGLDWYRKDPKVLFAIIDSEKGGFGPPGTGAPNVYLGITSEGEDPAGAKLSEVVPGGPADKAGIKAGDVVLTFGDKPTPKYDVLVEQLRLRKTGDKVKIKLKRDAKELEVEVALTARPTRPDEGVEGPLLVDPTRPFGSMLGGQIENAQSRQGPDGFQYGGVYKSVDGGDTWTRINSLNPRPMYFSQIRVDPSDDKYVYVLGVSMSRSTDGGKSFRGDGGRNVHADGHALWVDPKDGRHMIHGCDGGIYATYDRMNQWDHFNHLALGQFYQVALDTRRDYKVYGGLQDNGSWGGPAISRTGGAVNEDWVGVGFGDGFKCQVDPTDPDQIYITSQNGNLFRRNLKTGRFASIRPVAVPGKRYRFNWNTPFILAHQNPKIYYAAGNVVFRSLNQGEDLRVISPDLPKNEKGTATALAESPKNPDVLYVGTDDGNLWVIKNGGKDWSEISAKVGLPGARYVATIEASHFEEGRVYVVFDAHRSNDDEPYVFVSEDFGQTWKSLRANLPKCSTRCLREDLVNPALLFLGTEFRFWASIDRGTSWTEINNNLPTVAVLDLAIHPTAGEIVVATHGRSLWAVDVNALRQATPDLLKTDAALIKPISLIRWRQESPRGGTNRKFVGQNPPTGAGFYAYLGKKAEKSASLKIFDVEGKLLRELAMTRDAGLQRVTWDMTRTLAAPPVAPGTRPSLGAQLSRALGAGAKIASAPVGSYRLVLTVDGKEYSQVLKIEADPAYPNDGQSALENMGEEEALDEELLERIREGEID